MGAPLNEAQRPDAQANQAPRTGRRDFLKKAGLTTAGAVVALGGGAFGFSKAREAGFLGGASPNASTGEKKAAATSTIQTLSSKDAVTAAAASAAKEKGALSYGEVVITGAPTSVDAGITNEAHDKFNNKIGHGTQSFVAEPGGLLVADNKDTGDYAWLLNSITQSVMHDSKDPFEQNLPEGGFIFATGAYMTVQIDGATFQLPYVQNNNYFLIARGNYGDGKQNADRNTKAIFTNFNGGNAQVMMYPSGPGGTAYISENQFAGNVQISLSNSPVGGDGGNSIVTAVMYDRNTGAITVVRHTGPQKEPISQIEQSQNWQLRGSNFVTS